MKKIIFVSLILLLGFAPHVFAQGFVPLAPIPGLTQGGAVDSGNLADFFNSLYKYLIGLAATLAIIQIIWGGVNIATNQDDVSKIMDDKGKIYNAIFGLVLVLSPVLVFSIINPNILNLSLNLPPIDTTITPPDNRTPAPTNSFNSSYPCSASGDCAAAQASCKNAGGVTDDRRWCLNKSGDFDGGGSCSEGESFVIKCMPIPAQNKDFSVTKNDLYECSADGNCDSASASCRSDGGRSGEAVCAIKKGNTLTIDPTGKKFDFNSPLQGSCIDGDQMAVKCIWLGAKQ